MTATATVGNVIQVAGPAVDIHAQVVVRDVVPAVPQPRKVRVAQTGGTLVHGPDGFGHFVVDAVLRW